MITTLQECNAALGVRRELKTELHNLWKIDLSHTVDAAADEQVRSEENDPMNHLADVLRLPAVEAATVATADVERLASSRHGVILMVYQKIVDRTFFFGTPHW